MSYVGPWTVDPDSLEAAIREWVENYSPTQFERDQVDDWVLRAAEDGPWLVGTEDKEKGKGLLYGVPKDTNIVIEYAAMISYLQIWISTIRPRA